MRIIILLLLCYSSYSQVGTYGWTGDIEISQRDLTDNIHQYKVLGYKGVKFISRWTDDQPTLADESHTLLLTNLKIITDSGLEVVLHTWKGDYAPIVSPNNWLVGAGVPIFFTTGGSKAGPWPDYYDADYIFYSDRYDRTLADSLKAYIIRYPTFASRFKGWFSSHGSTGDEGPIKGVAPPPYDDIDNDATWFLYVQDRLDLTFARLAGVRPLALNPGNDAENLLVYHTRYPGVIFKHGDASHGYPVNGETYSINWLPSNYFGEFDIPVKNSPYPADQFQCIRSFLSLKRANGQFFDTWAYLSHTPYMAAFLNKYSNQFNPVTANKGFVALAEKVNFLDSVNYPESTWGQVFTDDATYWGQIAFVNGSADDTFQKQIRYVNVAYNNRNLSRVAAFQAAGYKLLPIPIVSEDQLNYDNDICWYCVQNYSLNMTQMLVFETSTGALRIDGGSLFGRNARIPKLYDGKTALYFDIDDNLIVTPGSDVIQVKVTYKDSGYAEWGIGQASRCGTTNYTVINTNTNLWNTVTFNLGSFRKGNKMPRVVAADLVIEVFSGGAFPIDMVEVENLSKP